jgi:phosphatidylinositol-3-phosphatase
MTDGTEPGTPPPADASGLQVDAFVIVLENHSFGQVIGNPDAPYINGLAGRGTLFTRYFGLLHPSLPNYLAILGGSTFGIRSDCTDCQAKDPNLAEQLSEAGVSWRAYMEGMPEPCYPGADHGSYAKRHNPFLYFPSVVSEADLCNQVVPAERLESDRRDGTLPAFGWLTPDLCHDAHDCPLREADQYLATVVPTVLPHLSRHGFLVLTFDEGTETDFSGPGGGRITTILAGPAVRSGARVSTTLDHYALLRTLEEAFGLPLLRAAAQAPDLSAAFEDGAVPSP